MTEPFDPYYQWLGIPPHEQPPNHYRLLGLQPLESNATAISNAADRLMAFVKTHATGAHSAESQALLNELAAARVTLLDAAKKAEYDERLLVQSSPLPAPSVVASPPASPAGLVFAVAPSFDAPLAPGQDFPAAPPSPFANVSRFGSPGVGNSGPTRSIKLTTVSPTTVSPTTATPVSPSRPQPTFATAPDFSIPPAPAAPASPRSAPPARPSAAPSASEMPAWRRPPIKKSRPRLVRPVAIAVGVFMAFTLTALVMVFDVLDHWPKFRASLNSPTEPRSPSRPPVPPQETPVETPVESQFGETSLPSDESPRTQRKPSAPRLAGVIGPGESVNLLEMLEGFDWRRHGYDWGRHIEGQPGASGLTVRPEVNLGRVPLPVFIYGDYELECDLQLVEGKKHFGLVFPVGVNNVALDLHAEHGGVTTDGLDTIDEVWSYDLANPTTRSPTRIQDHEKHRIKIRVEHQAERAKIVVGLDDDPSYIAWEGRQEQLANGRSWDPMCVGRPWLGVWEGVLRCERMQLKMLTGEMRRDSYTYADRQQDLANGFMRLVGEPRRDASSGWASVVVNQLPPEYDVAQVWRAWPLVTADFKYCDDYYPAPTPSRLEAPIPAGAKSFSVVAYNDCSRTSTFEVEVDGQKVYHTPRGGIVLIKVDLPPNAANLALIAGEYENAKGDYASWCYPRYHTVAAKEIADESIDGPAGDLPFRLPVPTGGMIEQRGKPHFTHFTRGGDSILGPPAPLAYRSARVCDEFIFAHGASKITFDIPPGMTRFTAVGYNALSRDAEFVVASPHSQIYSSGKAGIVAINAKLPPGLTSLTLEVKDRGNNDADQAMWCYPRLHRE